jgi:hypothetical protein
VGPSGFRFFRLSKTGSKLKIKMYVLSCSKNSQFLRVMRLGHPKQFSESCRHQIPNTKRVKNSRTDSIFEFLMNFRRLLNLLEKSEKFSRIPS